MNQQFVASRPLVATAARSAPSAVGAAGSRHLTLHLRLFFSWLVTLLVVPTMPQSSALSATLSVPQVFSTIQAAVDAAAPLDTILVGPGTYLENIDSHSKWLVFVGGAGAAATILDGNRRGSVLKLLGGGIVEGFTIRGGQAQGGGGVFVDGPAQAILRGNIIVDNIAGYFVDSGLGGGVYLGAYSHDVLVEGNEIRDNYAGDEGGGIYDASTLEFGNEIRSNSIIGNGCHVCGGGVALGLAALVGNLILENWSDSFGGGVCGAGRETRGNTIVRNFTHNSFFNSAGIHANSGLAIVNNIVAGNHGPAGLNVGVGIACDTDFPVGLRIECNNSWGNAGGDYYLYAGGTCDSTGGRNISVDPMFCDEATRDFHLRPGSPCAPSATGPCGLIGAFPVGVGCVPSPGIRRSWGRIKVLYR